jgi:phosphate transport system substrate-binding protein
VCRVVVHVSTHVHASFTEGAGSVHLACLASCHVTQTARLRRPGTLQLKGTELKLSTTTRAAAVSTALAATLALAACGASNETSSPAAATGGSAASSAPELEGSLVGAGSSAQTAAMTAWQAGFNTMQPGVTFSYDPVGSGGGREQFLAGSIDFAGSDSALSDDELAKATTACGDGGVFELPNYISAIAVIYNLEGVSDLNLAPATLAGIFSGAITTWNAPEIAADNPGVTLPATAIAPVHRSDKSGTTKNFTDYLASAAKDVWTNKAADEWPVQGGEAANGTSGVVDAVKAGAGAIGYADESQAAGLSIAKVKVGDTFVAPSPEAAAAVVANSETVSGRGENDLAIKVNRTTTSADEYPIVLVSYHIGCVEMKDQAKADALKAFETYVVSEDGQAAAAKNAGSSPITDDARTAAEKVIEAITVAS